MKKRILSFFYQSNCPNKIRKQLGRLREIAMLFFGFAGRCAILLCHSSGKSELFLSMSYFTNLTLKDSWPLTEMIILSEETIRVESYLIGLIVLGE